MFQEVLDVPQTGEKYFAGSPVCSLWYTVHNKIEYSLYMHVEHGIYGIPVPIGSMYGIYANIWGILMVNVTIYSSTMDPMGYCTIGQLGGGFKHFIFFHILGIVTPTD